MTNETQNPEKMEWGCRPRRKWFFFIPVIVVAALALFSYIVMLLWNCVVVDVFSSLHTISFWQAAGILVLSKILFGGFRGRRGGWRGRRHMYWNQKWAGMSEEEKAKFKEEWRKRCECK